MTKTHLSHGHYQTSNVDVLAVFSATDRCLGVVGVVFSFLFLSHPRFLFSQLNASVIQCLAVVVVVVVCSFLYGFSSVTVPMRTDDSSAARFLLALTHCVDGLFAWPCPLLQGGIRILRNL